MSVFQEAQHDLERQIVKLQKQNDALERDRDRIAELMRAEKANGVAKNKRIEELEATVKSAEDKARDRALVAGRLATAESKMGEAQTRASRLESDLAATQGKLDAVVANRDQIRESLTVCEAERKRLSEEIAPFRSLIGALKDKHAAESVIAAEIVRLDA